MALIIVASGLVHIVGGTVVPLPHQPEAVPYGTETLTLVLVLRAFASGSVALTGVEAIANGVPAFKPPEARNAANTLVAMAVLLGVIFIGVTLVARAYDIVPSVSLSGGPTVIALVAQTAFGDSTPAVLPVPDRDGPDPVPGREHELQRVPATGRDPGRGRLLPAPVQLPRRPARLQLGDHPPGRDRGGAVRPVPGQHDQPDPAVLRGRVRVLHALPGRHGPPLGPDPRLGLAVARLRQRLRRPADVRRPGHRRDREVLRRRLRGRHPDPAAGRDDAVHPPPVRPVGAPARDQQVLRRGAADPRGAGDRPDPRAEPRRRPGGQRRPLDLRAGDGRLHHRRPGGGGRAAGAVAAPGAGRAAGRRRVAVSGARRAPRRLPRRPRPRVAAGQAGADHVRRPARVRRPQLVGADPVQPVRAAPAERAARPTPHGHRRRALPARRRRPAQARAGPSQGIDVAVGADEVHDDRRTMRRPPTGTGPEPVVS